MQNRTVGTEATQYAAIHLEQSIEIDRLQYLLSDLYAPQQDLTTASFPELVRLVKELDTNGDNWLEPIELADMLTVKPHLKLSIAFDEAKAPHAATAKLQVGDPAPEIAAIEQPSADRAVFSLGRTRLIVSAHKLAPQQDSAQNATPTAGPANRPASQVRLMVHDQADPLFEELDTNADGKLGERELVSSPDRLLERDANGDRQLTNDELPYSMIVAFLLGEAPAEQSFYVPQSLATAKSDIALPAWFADADLNTDGDVSPREFVGSAAHFSLLDTNKDGYIGADEAAAIESK
jgi:Ca2+-binding EF-hand superfamily protein